MMELHTHALGVLDPDSFLDIHLRDIHSLVRLNCHAYEHLIARDEIEDLFHEVILLLIEEDCCRLRSFDGRASFKTWLSTVIRNHITNYAHRRKRTESLEVQAVTLVYGPTQESNVISENLIERLRAIVDELSERERRLFDILYVKGLDTAQAAKLMGIRIESTHRYKHMFIKKLRRFLDEWAAKKNEKNCD